MTTREDEIRARLEKATPGPWVWQSRPKGVDLVCRAEDEQVRSAVICQADYVYEMDASLIANAPSDIDYLLKENQRLREALKQIVQIGINGKEECDYYDVASSIARQALNGDAP